MDNRTLMMLRVFINRYQPQTGDALLKFLPPEMMQAVQRQNIRSNDITPLLNQPQRLIKSFHHSWIKPALVHFPSKLHPLVISALNPEQIAGLMPGTTPLALSPPVKNFLINQLYTYLHTEDHLPLEYLPLSDLTPLATWSRSRLMNLVDFLAMHDLASEVRRIVNKQHLKNIYSCLSASQLNYLNVCLHQRETVVVPKLGIDPSQQDCPKLKQILHGRGLLRLGHALREQHPDLVWTIAHILDTSRGTILLNTYQPKSDPRVTPTLKTQVLNLMNYLPSLQASSK